MKKLRWGGGMQSVFQVQELARQHQEVEMGGMQSVFHISCRSCARQHQEGATGGMQIVFQFRCRSWRASIKKLRWGECKLYFSSGAGAGVPASRRCDGGNANCISVQVQELARQDQEGELFWRESKLYFRCRSWCAGRMKVSCFREKVNCISGAGAARASRMKVCRGEREGYPRLRSWWASMMKVCRGGTRRVSQVQKLVRQQDEGVSGGNEKGIPGAEAGAPAG